LRERRPLTETERLWLEGSNPLRERFHTATETLDLRPSRPRLRPALAASLLGVVAVLSPVGGIDEPGVDAGAGGALRLGQELDLILLSLTPEVGASYHTFGGAFEPTHTSGFVGARLSFGKVLEPGVFAHVGVGHLSVEGGSETAPALDAGVSLDLTLLPVIDLGAHAAYDALLVSDADAFDWYRFGVHAALSF
jgi:hypothetical protein